MSEQLKKQIVDRIHTFSYRSAEPLLVASNYYTNPLGDTTIFEVDVADGVNAYPDLADFIVAALASFVEDLGERDWTFDFAISRVTAVQPDQCVRLFEGRIPEYGWSRLAISERSKCLVGICFKSITFVVVDTFGQYSIAMWTPGESE